MSMKNKRLIEKEKKTPEYIRITNIHCAIDSHTFVCFSNIFYSQQELIKTKKEEEKKRSQKLFNVTGKQIISIEKN
jgi:hypothetical protein